MKSTYGDDRQDRLIEDVIPPESPTFDVRNPYVQHQAIGALDDSYWREKHPRASYSDELPKPRRRFLNYTRIPPLAALAADQSSAEALDTAPLGKTIRDHWRSLAAATSAAALGVVAWLKDARLKYLPRRVYSLEEGQHIYWGEHKVANKLKLAIALAIIGLFVIISLVIGSLTGSKTHHNRFASTQSHGHRPVGTAITKTTVTTPAAPASQTLPAASSSSSTGSSGSSALPVSDQSTANTSPYSSSLSGGRGGGSTSTGGGSGSTGGTSSGGSSSGLLTIPGQDLQAGGKTILNTGPITVN